MVSKHKSCDCLLFCICCCCSRRYIRTVRRSVRHGWYLRCTGDTWYLVQHSCVSAVRLLSDRILPTDTLHYLMMVCAVEQFFCFFFTVAVFIWDVRTSRKARKRGAVHVCGQQFNSLTIWILIGP